MQCRASTTIWGGTSAPSQYLGFCDQADYCPWGRKESDTAERAHIPVWTHVPVWKTHTCVNTRTCVKDTYLCEHTYLCERHIPVWTHIPVWKTVGRRQADWESFQTVNKYGSVCVCVCVCVSGLVVSDSLWPQGLWPARLLCPWESPDKNAAVGCHSVLQEIFPTQGLKPGLSHCRQILYHLSCQASPNMTLSEGKRWAKVE